MGSVASGLRGVFAGPRGVRAGWRFLAFVVIVIVCQIALLKGIVAAGYRQGAMWEPQHFLVGEFAFFIPILVATTVMGLLERRRLTSYGLAGPNQQAARFGQGIVWGLLLISTIVAAIWAFGGYNVTGLNIRGADVARFTAIWASLLLFAAFTEELAFRGYPLFTLIEGMGFWPAAILLSLLFGAAHLSKPGENWLDICNIVGFGIFTSFTVYRTGTIWFATGFHAAFNVFGLFVYSAPNGGQRLPGHLLQSAFTGPPWLSGGRLGPESTIFVLPLLLLLFALFARRFPESKDYAVMRRTSCSDVSPASIRARAS